MHGRSRIGKSELIKESLKNIPYKKIYFECQKASEEFNISNLLKLIICGSYIDIMESLINSTSLLYGRFTNKMNIKQMNYLESSLF